MLGARPEPSAAFSALAMTRSRFSRLRRPGTARVTIFSPGLPTMSPIRRIRMADVYLRTAGSKPASGEAAVDYLLAVLRDQVWSRLAGRRLSGYVGKP